jgi:hypothetical protein
LALGGAGVVVVVVVAEVEFVIGPGRDVCLPNTARVLEVAE